MQKKTISLLSFLILFCINVFSQMQNPPTTEWKKIDTEHFEIVFPSEIEKHGLRAANLLEYIYQPVTKSLKVSPEPITVFLFNRSSISNAYVTYAPRYSVWYSTPSQSSISLHNSDWYQTLALHEYRHVAQRKLKKRNLNRIFSFLTGEMGEIMAEYSLPLWFDEGDAVCTETALSNSGRGRLASFTMPIRTMLLSNKMFSYDKALLGSYNDYNINPYELGYLLTSYLRTHYGEDIIYNTINKMTKYSFYPYAFSRALKYNTNKNTYQLYNAVIDSLKTQWTTQASNITYTEADTISAKQKKWTSYYYPHFLNDTTIVALKNGIDIPKEIVTIFKNGTEYTVKQTTTEELSLTSNKLCYSVKTRNMRWGEVSYSDIYIYDFNIDETHRLTKKQKYYAPTLSNDCKTIACVELNDSMNCQLVIINALDGQVLKKLPNIGNNFIRQPAWSADNETLVFTQVNNKGLALMLINVNTNSITELIPFCNENISNPLFFKNFIIYNSDFSGIDNIYAININTKKRFKITSRKFGAFNASLSQDMKTLYFQDYTANGFQIAKMKIVENDWQPIENVEKYDLELNKAIIEQEKSGNIFKDGDPEIKNYEVKKYNTLKNSLYFHSWAAYPWFGNFYAYALSQNKLNTLSMKIGTNYNYNQAVYRPFASIEYSKFFPVFSLSFDFGKRIATYSLPEPNATFTDTWNEKSGSFKVAIPLNFSNEIYYNYLNLSSSISYTNISEMNYYEEFGKNYNGTFLSPHYNITFLRYSHLAINDIYPNWGQEFIFDYFHTPFKSDYQGKAFAAQGNFYLPGLWSSHSTRIETAYEKLVYNNYLFESSVRFPRGYTILYIGSLAKASFNYTFPIWHPDKRIGALLYFKRLKTNLFYDYGIVYASKKKHYFRSYGSEISTEFNIFRLPYTLDMGVRITYPELLKKFTTQFVFFSIRL